MSRNARLGIAFFLAYAVVYFGFVGICTFRYDWMGVIVVAGLNLAIVYGLGLIALAVVMAVIYLLLCRPEGDVSTVAEMSAPQSDGPPAPSPGTAGRGLG